MEDIVKPDRGWLTGRETDPHSLAYGELVVPEINIRVNCGPISEQMGTTGRLPHGKQVRVLEDKWYSTEERHYFKVSANEVIGWIPEPFIAWKWSCFTFLGSLHPSEACYQLDIAIDFAGMQMLIKQNNLAVMAEGDPASFDCIRAAVSNFINRVVAAQASLSTVSIRPELTYWVEVPVESDEANRTVGFMKIQEKEVRSITNDHITTAQPIVYFMTQTPYLDLALSDFTSALNYPQHALIFLARAIESIERFCEGRAVPDKKKKGGREGKMRDLLGVKKSDVEYIMRRANESHRRHAASDGVQKELPEEELAQCFEKSALIIAAFVNFLGHAGLK